MLGELAALGSALGWAVAVVLSKPITTRLSAESIQATYLWLAMLLSLVLALSLGKLGDMFSGSHFATSMLIIGPLLGSAGDFLLIKALSTATVGRLLTIMSSLFVLFTAFGSVFLLGDSMGAKDWLGAVLILGGVFVANRTGPPRGVVPARAKSNGWHDWLPLILPALVGILWATSLLMWDAGLKDVDPVAAVALGNLAPGIICAVLVIFMPTMRPAASSMKDTATLAMAGILYGGCVIISIFAVDIAHAGLTSILMSSSPLFAIPLSAIFLKERFSLLAGAGMALCLAGVVAVVV